MLKWSSEPVVKDELLWRKTYALTIFLCFFRGNGGGTYFLQLFLCCIMDNNFNVNDLRSFAKERSEKFRPGACFSKVPKLFGPITGATVAFLSSQRRASKPSNFAILLVFLILKTCKKISFSKQADCSLATSFSGPKSSRDFRETGPWTGLEPRSLWCQCSAPPAELSGQLGAGHYLCYW